MSNEDVNITAELNSADPIKRKEILGSYLEKLVKEILGLEQSEPLDLNAGFADLGLDSVAATQLRKLINESLEGLLEIVTPDIFAYPSLNKLISFIDSKLGSVPGEKNEVKDDRLSHRDLDTMSDEDLFKELDSHLEE